MTPLHLVCAVLALCPVTCLLAWVCGAGSFSEWCWRFSVPALMALGAIATVVALRMPHSDLHVALVTGALGGLLGTLAYDLVRVPFQVFGIRLLAPVDSYGLLILDATSSSPWTGLAGWLFHFANGIGFGIAYGCVARNRSWAWAVGWALGLETATLLTPFADRYGVAGKWGLIGLAYGAHVPYGMALGKAVENGDRWMAHLAEVSPRAMPYLLLALVAGLVLWQRPFTSDASQRAGTQVADGPSAIVAGGRFSPQWLRVPQGGCASLRNDDAVPYRLSGAVGSALLVPHVTTRVCFGEAGVRRVRTSGAPYAGGFVIVDPALAARP